MATTMGHMKKPHVLWFMCKTVSLFMNDLPTVQMWIGARQHDTWNVWGLWIHIYIRVDAVIFYDKRDLDLSL